MSARRTLGGIRVQAPQDPNYLIKEHLDSIVDPVERLGFAYQYDNQQQETDTFLIYVMDTLNENITYSALNDFLNILDQNNFDLTHRQETAVRNKLLETSNNSVQSINGRLYYFLQQGWFENAFRIAADVFGRVNNDNLNLQFVNKSLNMAYSKLDMIVVKFLNAYFPDEVVANLTNMHNNTTSNPIRDFTAQALNEIQQ